MHAVLARARREQRQRLLGMVREDLGDLLDRQPGGHTRAPDPLNARTMIGAITGRGYGPQPHAALTG